MTAAPTGPEGEAIRELRILTTCRRDATRREIGQHRGDCLADYRADVEVLARLVCCGHSPHPVPCDVEVTLGQRLDGDAHLGTCGCAAPTGPEPRTDAAAGR